MSLNTAYIKQHVSGKNSGHLSARTEIEKLNYSINFEQSVCCCGFRFVTTKLEFFKSFIVCLNTLCPDEDSVVIVKSSVFISLCWVNDCYLCDWSLKLGGGRSQFYISHSAIPSWVHVGHSGYGPFTPNSIGILHNHHVIHSDIASFLEPGAETRLGSSVSKSCLLFSTQILLCGVDCWFLGTVLAVLLTKIDRGACH